MNVMKHDVMPSISVVDQLILNNVVEVRETLATEFNLSKKENRSFGLADLWNIRRKAKIATAATRRY
jgi:hypothetical protein